MRYNKILLISPRFHKGKFSLSITPLAGLGYIAESLKNAGFVVGVFDMNLRYSYKDLQGKISDFNPDIIGFTVMTFGHRDVYTVINRIKKSYPEIKIVAGGPHISTLREKVLRDCPSIDYGIVLEGDFSMIELCQGKDLKSIQGLVYRENEKILTNSYEEFIKNLDQLSFPKYEAFELQKYPVKQIGIVSSRGCPFSCTYCPVIAAIGKKFRQRSAENIIAEIDYWYGKGYREILFLDDNFTLSRERVGRICELIKERNYKGIKFKCPNGIRADRVDYEILKAMREVGFDMIAFGVEASSDKVLKNIKKGENIATIEKSIENACDLGFDVDLFFLIGSPGETLEDVKNSFSLALRYPIRNAHFYNIIPFPATELYDWLKEKGYFVRSPETVLNNASHFINEPSFYTPEMSVEDRKKAFKMGQTVTRSVRKKFLERKIKGPIIFRKVFSWIYTTYLIQRMIFSNSMVIRFKEGLKKRFLR
ncbi:MAG: radical SAM protein [Elusimicrobia bacterium]|nr:radical SAM protein [Elusimicrobiota bacterium]